MDSSRKAAYSVLGLTPFASDVELAARYEFLVRAFRTENFPDHMKAAAQEEVSKVTGAYQLLCGSRGADAARHFHVQGFAHAAPPPSGNTPSFPPIGKLVLFGAWIVGSLALVIYLGASLAEDNSSGPAKGTDGLFVPYDLTGLGVVLCDDSTGRCGEVGSVSGSYDERSSLKASCRAIARDQAQAQDLSDWSYVCCTRTPTSNCATKVR